MAHELNQPLTVILANVLLLQEKLLQENSTGVDKETNASMEQILESTYRMSDIVKRLTKITRYETQPYHDGEKIVDLEESTQD